MAYQNLKPNGKALDFFKKIKQEFPSSTEAANIDAFIGKAEAASN